ncbi:hypothetical protein HYH03_010404 [Edaphochlamys debaryana]|uniref:Uncharacterized protein n=1 Tax=Edaphochlamys debaryana TaxID=47281 RepID=A0A835Y531_9CHLO|nr:hypothetical protein HYH03_010404 [Edaphochlamys debaryana]|eukprot:KAG2491194.1 hypothetical protein HYH03_010404 [Edaphochlamys debaryana]
MASNKHQKRSGAAEELAPAGHQAGPDMTADASLVWLPGVIECIAARLGGNEAACLRVVSKATAAALGDRATLILSKPMPQWAFRERWSAPGACRDMTRSQRQQFVCLVAASNDVANLEVALAATGLSPTPSLLEAAASGGAMETLLWLLGPGGLQPRVRWVEVLCAAASTNQRCVVDYILERTEAELLPPDVDQAYQGTLRTTCVRAARVVAARAGHTALFEHFAKVASEADMDFEALDSGLAYAHDMLELYAAALEGCDLATVKRLVSEYGEVHQLRAFLEEEEVEEEEEEDVEDIETLVAAALRSRQSDWRERAEWALAQGELLRGEAAEECYLAVRLASCDAASPGLGPAAVERFEWLKGKGCPPESVRLVLGAAVEEGNLEAVQYLLAEGCEMAEESLFEVQMAAAEQGHLAVLQALEQAGCEIETEAVVYGAAAGGRLDVLKWAVETFEVTLHNFGQMAHVAIVAGSLETVRWFVTDQAGPRAAVTERDWVAAVRSGSEAMVELLAELGCPKPDDGEAYHYALHKGEWRMLPALRRAGLSFGPPHQRLMVAAIDAGAPLATLQWLEGSGCPGLDWAEVQAAAERAGELGGSSGDEEEEEDGEEGSEGREEGEEEDEEETEESDESGYEDGSSEEGSEGSGSEDEDRPQGYQSAAQAEEVLAWVREQSARRQGPAGGRR